ncbi:hypothetical protein [Microbacterium sp. P02]|uniref:hypothetical protein n=1 Tax=Microbacterium sp. P02 TaxID=3366260 RepID=UPI00366E1AC4
MGRPARRQRYRLHRTDLFTWVITYAGTTEPGAHPVAHLTLNEHDQVDAVWVPPRPLPVLFATVGDALDSLQEWEDRPDGASKPIPIPHRPPPRRRPQG